MLKASSLMYALTISLLIALVIGSVIMFSGFTHRELQQLLLNDKGIRNSSSGITLLMGDQEIIKSGESKTLDLYGEGTDSVLLKKQNWGVFDLITSKSIQKGNAKTLMALSGSGFDSATCCALYLEDDDKPLSVCGATLIKGHCFLPKAGIKRAYIEGENFTGSKMTEGTVENSKKQLPEIEQALITELKTYFTGECIHAGDSVMNIDEQGLRDTVYNSFGKKTIFLISGENIKLTNRKIGGNIVLISTKKITISDDCSLEDVLVFAPKIEIEDGFTGNLQVFASDSLLIGKECKLNYPSAIGVLSIVSDSVAKPNALIKDQTIIEGVVLGYQDETNEKKSLSVSIDKGVKITGQVYCNGSLDLKGSVFGTVMCKRFVLTTSSSVYENELLDAVIDNSKLPGYFAGLALDEKKYLKKIVKWLY